jgi:twitching motility protein PilT
MVGTPGVRNIVREGKIEQLYSVMQTSMKERMQTMNRSLAELTKRGIISHEKAIAHSSNVKDLRLLLSQTT